MFDARLRTAIDPVLNRLAKGCIALGLDANSLTLIGFFFGILCAIFIAMGAFYAGLICLIVNRLCDGLDGAVARLKTSSDLGGYLDIVCDFLFYALVPFSFVWFDSTNGLAASFLIVSFVGTGSSFLAYAILEAKNQDAVASKQAAKKTQKKSFYYLGGLTEGAETIAVFVLMLVFPSFFSVFAWIFGILCLFTTGWRIHMAYSDFKG